MNQGHVHRSMGEGLIFGCIKGACYEDSSFTLEDNLEEHTHGSHKHDFLKDVHRTRVQPHRSVVAHIGDNNCRVRNLRKNGLYHLHLTPRGCCQQQPECAKSSFDWPLGMSMPDPRLCLAQSVPSEHASTEAYYLNLVGLKPDL